MAFLQGRDPPVSSSLMGGTVAESDGFSPDKVCPVKAHKTSGGMPTLRDWILKDAVPM